MASDGSVCVADAGNDRVQRFGYVYASTWRSTATTPGWPGRRRRPARRRRCPSTGGRFALGLPAAGWLLGPLVHLPAPCRGQLSLRGAGPEGGVRLWVGEELLVEDWGGQGRLEEVGEFTLGQDDYVFVEAHYRNMEGPASFRVVWRRVG